MSSPILSTTNYRLQTCFRLIDDIVTSNNYYFFIGDSHTHSNSSLQSVYDNTSNTVIDAYSNMIAGKKVISTDVFIVAPNIPWTTGTVYDMYDSADPDLLGKSFYVVTTEGGFNHFWKVLDNNFGSASTVQPSIIYIVGSSYIQTADGYRWKYMTSVNLGTAEKFITSGYIPLVANSTVESEAIPGALDIFKLTGNGAFYNNYISGTFRATDIAVSGDQTLYNISNSVVSTVNGYYTGCLLYITSGTGQGQYATITDFTSNTVGNLVRIQHPFVTIPQNSSTYDITPQLKVISDGKQTINCVARALINANASNSIYRIESLEAGAGYFNVANVSVIANVVVAVVNTAVIHPILPPKGGHGSNVYSELYSNSVGISIFLANTEKSTILATNIYQQIGLLNAPKFANVVFSFTGGAANGVFLGGENIYGMVLVQFAANVSVNANSTSISCNAANFVSQVKAGDLIYIQGATNQLATVNSVVNTTFLYVTSNIVTSCTEAILSFTTIQDSGFVTTGGQNQLVIDNCTPNFHSGSFCVGSQSGATGSISSISRNGTVEFFDTFQECYKYNAALLNGTLQQEETVVQGNNTAKVYAVTGSGLNAFIYLSNFTGGIFSNGTITGANSGATANLTEGHVPDIIFGSGDILYIENISPVTRANTETESFNLILSL